MAQFFVKCPYCGAHLDPGERCTDCHPAQESETGGTKQKAKEVASARKMTLILPAHRTGRREIV